MVVASRPGSVRKEIESANTWCRMLTAYSPVLTLVRVHLMVVLNPWWKWKENPYLNQVYMSSWKCHFKNRSYLVIFIVPFYGWYWASGLSLGVPWKSCNRRGSSNVQIFLSESYLKFRGFIDPVHAGKIYGTPQCQAPPCWTAELKEHSLNLCGRRTFQEISN